MASNWSADMNKCSRCSIYKTCNDRKVILKAISPAMNELNMSKGEDIGIIGVIGIHCKYEQG